MLRVLGGCLLVLLRRCVAVASFFPSLASFPSLLSSTRSPSTGTSHSR